ncbi:MAG: putative metal-dependent hydrolase YcfH [Chlamydiia bacterium]|nr:putative metal-dependent hydrolase YcfH [Chlamydiia bacterium]
MKDQIFELMDSHAHLTSEDFLIDAEAAISRCNEESVTKVINICTNPNELREGLLLEKKYPNLIRNVASTTPHDSHKETEESFSFFEKMALQKRLVGIGETGFDDFIEPDNQKEQMEICRRYIDLGIRAELPVVFHVRGDKAFDNLFKLSKEFDAFTGIIHCFTGTIEQAKKALDLGWFISISGIATFKKSTELRDVIKQIPLDHLLVETDAPWLAPQGYRGQKNEPAYVRVVAETLSVLFECSLEEVSRITYENGLRAFPLAVKPFVEN